jgi:hypothetical protein
MLCCFGNGYEWRDGEIVKTADHSDYLAAHPRHRDAEAILAERIAARASENERMQRLGEEPEDTSVWMESDRRMAEEEAARNRHVQDNIDRLVAQGEPLVRMQGLSDPLFGRTMSPLASIPDDVTDDWLAACEETAHVVLACKRGVYSYDRDLEAPQPIDREKMQRECDLVSEILDLPSKQLPAQEEMEATEAAERSQRLAADRSDVERSHRIVRAALVRIAQIRASR